MVHDFNQSFGWGIYYEGSGTSAIVSESWINDDTGAVVLIDPEGSDGYLVLEMHEPGVRSSSESRLPSSAKRLI